MGKFAEQYGPWAVVTGASAGIGAEFARQIASRGVNIVLVARRRDRLEALASSIEDMHRVEVRVAPVDLTTDRIMETLAPAVDDIQVGLLVNNAGFGTSEPFLDAAFVQQETMLDLNCRAPVLLTHSLAQGMRERGRGGVIVVSSVMGFTAASGWASYTATKAFDLLFAESLAGELKPYGVHVQALCPGATRTEFQEVAGIRLEMGPLEPIAFATASSVVSTSLNKLGKRVTVVPGVLNKLNLFFGRFMPRWLNTALNSYIARRFAPPR